MADDLWRQYTASYGSAVTLETSPEAIDDARKEGRQGVVLTCRKALALYAKFGFENEGLSTSEHGGAVWYQMRLTFE